MKWLRNLLAGRDGGGIGRPCCGEYATCGRACVPRGKWIANRDAREALEALHTLYTETADYIELNNLGPVHHNRSMQRARDVLAKEGMTIWYGRAQNK